MSNERKDQIETPCGLAETLRGTPLGPHLETQPSGMQKDYVVLTAEERAKGFVEPVRRSYRHEKCGSITTMGVALAETYARCPDFYSGTFCVTCGNHFPVGATGEFTWEGTTQKVGTRRAPASDNPSPDGATTTTPARGSEEAGALLGEDVTGWWYLSFVDGGVFKGGCFVRANEMIGATCEAHRLQINPGGQVMGIPVPKGFLPEASSRERLLSKADIQKIWPDAKSLREFEEEEEREGVDDGKGESRAETGASYPLRGDLPRGGGDSPPEATPSPSRAGRAPAAEAPGIDRRLGDGDEGHVSRDGGLETEGRRLGKAAVAYFQSRKTYPSGEVAVGEIELRELRAAAVAFGERWTAAKGEGSDAR